MVELEVVNWEVEEGSQATWLGFSNGEKKEVVLMPTKLPPRVS